MVAAEAALYLADCALNGITPDKSRIEGVNLDELCGFAEAHMISAMLGYALESAGLNHRGFSQSRAKAMRKSVVQDSDYRVISERLESSGIWHMPLKGIVLRKYYPVFGMREMTDVDILIDPSRANDVRKIMKGLGFYVMDYCNHNHDVYQKKPVSSVEMHRGLIETWLNPAMGDYFYDVTDKIILDEGKKYTYHFGPEDFYLYIIAHTYLHYSEGGTGLRSLFDEYILMKEFSGSLDWEYISRELGKMNLVEFERDLRTLVMYLFGDESFSEINRKMLNYIIRSGTYGTVEDETDHIVNSLYGGSRIRYVLAKIFIPFNRLKYINPYIYTHKYLYPFFVIRRLFRAATYSRKNILARLRIIFRRRK